MRAHGTLFQVQRGTVPTMEGLSPWLPFSDAFLGRLFWKNLSPSSFPYCLIHRRSVPPDTQARLRSVQGHFPCQVHLQAAGFTTLPAHPGWNSCLPTAQRSSLNSKGCGIVTKPDSAWARLPGEDQAPQHPKVLSQQALGTQE